MLDEAWDDLRARDELAALSDGINAVDVEHDIGADTIRAGHYQRAMDIRDQADSVLAERHHPDLDRAQALIVEANRELHTAVPSLGAPAAQPVSPAPGAVAPAYPLPAGAQGLVSGLLGEVLADPKAFRERALAQSAQIRAQAKVTGNSTVVMVSSSGVLTPMTGQPGRQSADLADTLSKLAALRDRGALTEEEFQAQKQKLLEG
jgi:hypothetical protein